MRVFVIGTGRCGTVTFSKAAAHATNYTVGHESHAGRVGDWSYPDNHIEVSSQLIIAIPLLQAKYRDAKWIHLVRTDKAACVLSLARMPKVMRAFSLIFFQKPEPQLLLAAEAIYETITATGDFFCDHRLALETATSEWPRCWRMMGCEGDLDASTAEWQTKYNAFTGQL